MLRSATLPLQVKEPTVIAFTGNTSLPLDPLKQAHLRGFGLHSVGIGRQSHLGSDPLALSKYLPTLGTLEDRTAEKSPHTIHDGDLLHRWRMASEFANMRHGMDHLRLQRISDRRNLNGATLRLLSHGSRSPGGPNGTSQGKLAGD
ncbi:unnamed protein product [Thlaspi arvense]|uniref:Uncharacterized protein n=1 Tax=Thlaspi arvense TaxID=13288 RepID=A0AAU9T9B8_THLAR|nr:unnamed protein product [Thlaspi arvense]